MEIAVSSIAWTNEEEPMVAEKLRELGVKNVEIAPTKIWSDPTQTSYEDAITYVNWWKDRGIKISAFQSMLFARPDLKIFESEENRRENLEYMSRFLALAGVMDAKKLVFGSPKNRQRGEMAIEKANEIAREYFSELARVALDNGVVLCLEPNAPQYNCNFITNAQEGVDFVRSINSDGFGLHLDTACMHLAGDDMTQSIMESRDILEHFHISSPMLGAVEPNTEVDHASAAKALRDINYSRIVSIEMRPGEVGENVARVETAVRFAQSVYS